MRELALHPELANEAIGAPPPRIAATLPQLLRLRAHAAPDQTHLQVWQDDDRWAPLTYGQLLRGAAAVARGLRARGLRRGDTVGIMLPTCQEFFFTFLGTLLAGGVPVPLYPPFRADRIQEYAGRQSGILRNAEARTLVTFPQAERLARLLRPRVPSLATVTSVNSLAVNPDGRASAFDEPVEASPDDIALIQYTSGSTAEPRGAVLTHRNLIANVEAIGCGVQVRPADVTICWLPLFHDMGLIGCWLFSLYFGLPIVALSPLAFLRRPERWLWAVHRYRGTLSPAPNFAYELCVHKIDERAIAGLDLSSWRVALNGAEPVSPDTIERFSKRFAPCGFRPEAMMPVYGLAECSVALAFAALGRAPRVDAVAREGFERSGRAQPASPSDSRPLRFVSVGRPLPGHQVRVVDDADGPLGERREGHVQFRGASAMQGYHRDPEATRAAQHDGWYRTGDRGYLAEGELFFSGRAKDLIIKAGRNLCPQEIEEVAAEVAGVRRGCVAAFAVPDPNKGTEALVLLAETRETSEPVRARIVSEIRRRIGSTANVCPDVIRLVPPQVLPKTASGKLRRAACRDLYRRDALVAGPVPAWLQVTRLLAGTAVLELKQAAGRIAPASLKQWLAVSRPSRPGEPD